MISARPSLIFLADYVNGYAFTGDDLEGERWPVVRIQHLLDSSVPMDRTDLAIPRVAIRSGNLVLSWSATLATRIWDRGPALLNQHLFRVDPRRGVDTRWLKYVLDVACDLLASHMHGSAMTHITRDMMRRIRVTLPTPPKQRAIADYLDIETARIDALITKKRRMAQLIEERTQITSELVLGFEEESERAWVPLRHITSISGGLTLGKPPGGPTAKRPYLRVANVQDGWLDLTSIAEVEVPIDSVSRYELRQGDVLMLEGNGNPQNLGRGTIWRGELSGCLHQNHVHAVRASNLIDPEYLNRIVRTRWARRALTAGSEQVSIATLSQDKIKDLRVPLPSLKEQGRRAAAVARLRRWADKTSGVLVRQIDLLAEHRQALITAAVTGELAIPGTADARSH